MQILDIIPPDGSELLVLSSLRRSDEAMINSKSPPSKARPWEKTIEEYLDGSSVGGVVSMHRVSLDKHCKPDAAYKHHATTPHLPGYEFHLSSCCDFKIVHAATGGPVGAFVGSMTWVEPDHRGRGLMAELYCIADELGLRGADTNNLSMASFGALKGAHRRHVERASIAGLPVPERVMAQYEAAPQGGIRLRQDYTREMCNARREAGITSEMADDIRASLRLLSVRFFDEDVAETVVEHQRLDRTASDEGFALASALVSDMGGEIRITVVRGDETGQVLRLIHQAQIGDHVLDHAGIRPAHDAMADLTNRDLTELILCGWGEEVSFEILTFPDEATCRDWMVSIGYEDQFALSRDDERDAAFLTKVARSADGVLALAREWAGRELGMDSSPGPF